MRDLYKPRTIGASRSEGPPPAVSAPSESRGVRTPEGVPSEMGRERSWEWVPLSATFPSFNTQIWSARWTVESRCAITSVVRPFINLSRASCTSLSLCVSRAAVASSRTKILGFRRIALAMAILCLWPPDSCAPPSPTDCAYPLGNFMMNSWALASFAALSTSSSLTPEGTEKGGHALGSLPFPSFTAARWAAAELPYAMLSATVPEKRPGDCPTTARRLQNQSGSRFLKSTPSKKTCPESGA
mmetsp:Transcript_55765/g.109164  ORF Transcript_55765/g.109164 Transcript_55765/m.109164 type:complete len:243 (+) Transcript_55765:191-919(+)